MASALTLEDELGDVLEKALKLVGWCEDELAAHARIDVNRIKDALDYHSELTPGELATLARVLDLNEAGVLALGAGTFRPPGLPLLPFQLDVLAMPYGVGVVNAYLLRQNEAHGAVLVDSGHCPQALEQMWPPDARRLDAHLVTHWIADHTGGCGEMLARFDLPYCCGPGPAREGVRVLEPEERLVAGGFRIEAISTPGPAREHLCFLVRCDRDDASPSVLFTGDLIFCGSIGGGFFQPRAVLENARRLWRSLPGDTLIAPGHGPLTTVAHERAFNPFAE